MNTEAQTLNALVNEYKKERQDLMKNEIQYAKKKYDEDYDGKSADKYYKKLENKCDIYSKIFNVPVYTMSKKNKKYKIPTIICKLAIMETDLSYWRKEKYPDIPFDSPQIRSRTLNDIAKKNGIPL